MKYTYLLFLLLVLPIFSVAQQNNVFHGRNFWKTSPNVATVKAKIAAGNDPVALTPNGFDALVFAILENAPLKTIQYLLEQEGNDVNKSTHDGRNYLMWAANKGNIPLMKLLLDKNADTGITDDHGYNLMTFAAAGGQQSTAVYELLLANGGKADDTNRSGANVLLLLAPRLEDDQLIKFFEQKGLDIHSTDHQGNGMFNYAARLGNIDLMNKYIKMGLEYKKLNKEGGNAMMFASAGSRGHNNTLDVYKYLADLGIEADIVTRSGETPLHNLAFRTKDPAVFDFFIDRCVNINQIDEDGNTAFLNTIRGNNLEIAKKLAPSVKDINHVNNDGYSAITYAVRGNSTAAFDFLLDQGADLAVKDKYGNNLVYHTFEAYRSNNQEAFDHFLKAATTKGLSSTSTFEGGNTLVHLAVEKGAEYLVLKSLELGNDVNQKNKDGLTPLHLAAMKANNKSLLSLLLEKGADKSILTEFEESAFDLASENEKLNKQGTNLDFLKIK